MGNRVAAPCVRHTNTLGQTFIKNSMALVLLTFGKVSYYFRSGGKTWGIPYLTATHWQKFPELKPCIDLQYIVKIVRQQSGSHKNQYGSGFRAVYV